MLTLCKIVKGCKILDLGCGYGVVGIVCGHFTEQENVFMSDIDCDAVSLAEINSANNNVPHAHIIHSDGFNEISETEFDLILCNPPYHADFAIPKHFIEKGFNRLRIGGRMFMVMKRLEWYKRKLVDVFGGVTISRKSDYFIFEAVKTKPEYSKKLKNSRNQK